MFFDIKMLQAMCAWCFERLNCMKQRPTIVFRSFEARRKVSFTFLETTRQEESND